MEGCVGCDLTLLVAIFACCIASDKSDGELAMLAAFFNSLGDNLALIAVKRDNCEGEARGTSYPF
ncbi:MAG: hypothetical protein E7256_01025 [Lachnospiraceae bacterium]|nr:hypothetical protein [Lachnospiraceae bacterium]